MSSVAPITALITVHNGASYLAEAIKSVQLQTLPVAELLVVDDGSTDDSAAIAQEMGATVIRQAKGGAGDARNTGVLAASQEWVALLDHDDIWQPEKIELQWRAHRLCERSQLIFTDFCQFKADSNDLNVPSVFNLPESGFDALERTRLGDRCSCVEKVDKRVLTTINKNIFFPSAVMMRRDLAIAVGLFDAEIFPLDDIDFFLRCFAVTSIAFVEQPLMRYRLHSNNTTKNELKMFTAFFGFVRHMMERRELYPDGAVEIFTAPEALAQKQKEAGRLMIDAGRYVEARQLLRESMRRRLSLKPALLWLMTWLGAGSFARLLKMKRTLKSVVN